MVTTSPSCTDAIGVTQERRGWPFRCTVQAPHCATPQPYLVPVSLSSSRKTQRSGVSGSTSTLTFLPFTEKFVMRKCSGSDGLEWLGDMTAGWRAVLLLLLARFYPFISVAIETRRDASHAPARFTGATR